MTDRRRFLAVCPIGFEPELAADLRRVTGRPAGTDVGKAFFEGPLELAYRVSLRSRVASKVHLVLAHARVDSLDEARRAARDVDWPVVFSAGKTYGVVGTRVGVHDFTRVDLGREVGEGVGQRFVADGLSAPKVDLRDPEVEIHALLRDRDLHVTVNLTGPSLHRRTYRTHPHPAPLKSNLAAALLERSGVMDAPAPLADPLCGSGTLSIEAALAARRIPPFTLRPREPHLAPAPGRNDENDAEHSEAARETGYLLHHLQAFDPDVFHRERERALAEARPVSLAPLLWGSDRVGRHVRAARKQAERAGVAADVEFHQADLAGVDLPFHPRYVVVNPPYGRRIASKEELDPVYRQLHERLQEWAKAGPVTCVAIVGNRRLEALGSHEPTVARDVWNGNLSCRLLRYDL